MNIGLMWADSNPKTSTKDKILGAMEYYKNKYGSAANKVYVHPSMLIESWDGVTIAASRSVMPNHFWIGTEYIQPSQEMSRQEFAKEYLGEWEEQNDEDVQKFL